MKKLIILLLWFNIWGVYAQTDSIPSTDSIPHYPSMESRWLLLDVGWHALRQSNPNIDYAPFAIQSSRSWEFNLNIFRQHLNLYRDKVKFAYGFALEFDRYEWKNDYDIAPYSAVVTPTTAAVSYKRNSLNTMSLAVPFLLKFESNASDRLRSLHLAAGGFAAVEVSAASRQRTITGDRINTQGNFNLNQFRYGLQAEAGYSYVTFYARFDVNPFFIPIEDSGYEMNAWSMGLRLIPFL